MTKIFIFPKDVCSLTGLGIRQAQKLVQELRYLLNKGKYQYLTVKEFANHMGLEVADIVF